MPLEKIYVTRHGFRSGWTVDPTTGVYTASIRSPTGIPADPALTSHGVDQSKELALHLMKLNPPIECVYSSPYYRCLQTITPFVNLRQQSSSSQGLENGSDAATAIRPEGGLCEWFGSAPFEHPQPASPSVLKTMFPAYDQDYHSAVTPSRNGETLEQLYARVAQGLQAIISRCESEGRRSVVLCTHAAVVIVIGRILTGQVPANPEVRDFHAFTCGLSAYDRSSVSQVEGKEGVGSWVCELNGECSFLSGGEERGWYFAGDETFPSTGSMSQMDSESKL